jgi:hypothetical protein
MILDLARQVILGVLGNIAILAYWNRVLGMVRAREQNYGRRVVIQFEMPRGSVVESFSMKSLK